MVEHQQGNQVLVHQAKQSKTLETHNLIQLLKMTL